jgi:hypothetical protein
MPRQMVMASRLLLVFAIFSLLWTRSAENFSQLIDQARFAALDVYWSIIDIIETAQALPCQAWYALDPGPPNDLIPCPPTAAQANVDPHFEPDRACTSPPCYFHPGADFCIRSRTPSLSGGGQQCCYIGENILLGPPGGGTVDNCHYTKWLQLCHFVEDVVPWAMCCFNTPMELCHLYYEKRPSDPGTNYIPPQPVWDRGDPHITTFDYLDYTFNGAGEFWMVRNSSDMPMAVQSRMEPFTYPIAPAKVLRFSRRSSWKPTLHSRCRCRDLWWEPLTSTSKASYFYPKLFK